VDTALNIALEAIDRLKTTASSHQRAFLIEVMGRKCGYLALMAGIAGGAEMVVIPEVEIKPEQIADVLREAYRKGKTHGIIVVAEGAKYNATQLDQYFKAHKEQLEFDLRVTIIGHVQRGGVQVPTTVSWRVGWERVQLSKFKREISEFWWEP
jgi:6-phosphofructokinase 1